MTEYRKCGNCGRWGGAASHKCPPIWETQILETEEDDWTRIHAMDAKEAAEMRAEKYDEADHDMMDGEIITVLVRAMADVAGKEWRYCVSGEPVPTYYATEDAKDCPHTPQN